MVSVTAHPALTDKEYDRPGSSLGLLSVFQNRYLLKLLVQKGVKTRYYGSVLGWVWSYIRPLAQFLMYWVVIGIVLGVNRNIDEFPIHLFSGLIVVNLFGEIFRNTTNAILDNGSLIKKIFLPRELFPVAATGVALIHFLPQVAVLLVVVLIMGWSITWLSVLAFLAGLVIITVFALGLGLLFGAWNVAHRDMKNIVDLILMYSTWASPVIYPFIMIKDRAPEWLYLIYMANPVTIAVELFHTAFWRPIVTNPPVPEILTSYTFLGLGLAVVTLLVGQLVFRRMEGSFAQFV